MAHTRVTCSVTSFVLPITAVAPRSRTKLGMGMETTVFLIPAGLVTSMGMLLTSTPIRAPPRIKLRRRANARASSTTFVVGLAPLTTR